MAASFSASAISISSLASRSSLVSLVTALSEESSFWRSRISFCAACGIVPDRGVFGLGVQFVQAAVGGIPVKDASSAGRVACWMSSAAREISGRMGGVLKRSGLQNQ